MTRLTISPRTIAPAVLGVVLLAALMNNVIQAAEVETDQDFGNAGLTTVPIFGPGSNTAEEILVLDNSQVLVAGDVVARYNADGSIDPTFGQAGSTDVGIRVSSLARQADGRLLAAGTTGLGITGVTIGVARLLADGSIDSSFGTGGRFTLDFPSFSPDVAVLPDGRIVVTGDNRGGGGGVLVFALSPDGTLDPGFGEGGIVRDSYGDEATGTVTLADGKILVTGIGDAQQPSDPVCGGRTDGFVARYLGNGSLDPGFSASGVRWIDVAGCEDNPREIIERADGRIVVGLFSEVPRGGSFDEDFAIVQLLSNGDSDNSFGSNGVSLLDIEADDDQLDDIAVAPDGSVYAVGEVETFFGDQALLAKFLPTGAVDTTFGNQGRFVLPDPDGSSALSPFRIGVTSTGDVRVSYRAIVAGQEDDFALAGVLAAGALDPDFGSDGISIVDFLEQRPVISGNLLIDSAGRIYQIATDDRFVVLRYLADGTLDSGWGDGGMVITEFDAPVSAARRGLLQADGRLLVVGSDNRRFLVARYLANGSLDPAFGTGGRVILDPGLTTTAAAIALQSDGGIVIGGSTDGDFIVARLTDGGAVDGTFGVAGVSRLEDDGRFLRLNALAVLSDDRIIAGGGLNDFSLARLGPDGSVDSAFGTAGRVNIDFQGVGAELQSLTQASNGMLILAGYVQFGASTVDRALGVARINADGVLDSGFSDDGLLQIDLGSGFGTAGNAVAQDDNGDIYVAGTNQGESILVRLLADGAPDADFGQSGVASFATLGSEAGSGLVVESGRVLTGGSTSIGENFNASPRELFVRAVLKSGGLANGSIFSDGFESLPDAP